MCQVSEQKEEHQQDKPERSTQPRGTATCEGGRRWGAVVEQPVSQTGGMCGTVSAYIELVVYALVYLWRNIPLPIGTTNTLPPVTQGRRLEGTECRIE